MSLKLECHLNWNVTQIGMSVTFECHLILNVSQIRISLKLECHTTCNVTQIRMSLKYIDVYGNAASKDQVKLSELNSDFSN